MWVQKRSHEQERSVECTFFQSNCFFIQNACSFYSQGVPFILSIIVFKTISHRSRKMSFTCLSGKRQMYLPPIISIVTVTSKNAPHTIDSKHWTHFHFLSSGTAIITYIILPAIHTCKKRKTGRNGNRISTISTRKGNTTLNQSIYIGSREVRTSIHIRVGTDSVVRLLVSHNQYNIRSCLLCSNLHDGKRHDTQRKFL